MKRKINAKFAICHFCLQMLLHFSSISVHRVLSKMTVLHFHSWDSVPCVRVPQEGRGGSLGVSPRAAHGCAVISHRLGAMPSLERDQAASERAAAELPRARDTVFVLAEGGQMITDRAESLPG